MNDLSVAGTRPALSAAVLSHLLRPRMIKIAANGEPAAADAADHVAVLLPDFGLMFTAATISHADTWAEAKEEAAGVRLLGFEDWVLPEVEELQLLARRDRTNPAIDKECFPDTKTSDWYWSATPLASSPSVCAWYVGFDLGNVSCNRQDDGGFVRAVRRVPAGQ